MSLKLRLNELIKQQGYVSVDEINKFTEDLGYKRSNAERRLRPSESPEIQAVMKKGYIVGYKYERPDMSFVQKPEEEEKKKLRFGNSRQIHELKYKRC